MMHRRCNTKDQSFGLRNEKKKDIKRILKNERKKREKINKKKKPAPTPNPFYWHPKEMQWTRANSNN